MAGIPLPMYAAERHSIYRKPLYSSKRRTDDKLLFGVNLRQNNGMTVLNAVSERDPHCA